MLVPALPWALIGLVWAYNLVWMFVQDLAKLAVYHELDARAARATPFLARLTERLNPAQQRPAPAAPAYVQKATGGIADYVATALGLAAVAGLLWAGHLVTVGGAATASGAAPAASVEEHKEANASPEAQAPQTHVAPTATERPEEKAVPAPAAATAASAPAAAKAAVGLGLLPTEARAKGRWRQLEKRAPGLIANHQPVISKKEVNGRTAWFLEIADFNNKPEAAEFCQAIRARGVECEAIGE